MEVSSYDLYLKMAQRLDDPQRKDILLHLAREEKAQLDRLTDLFLRKPR